MHKDKQGNVLASLTEVKNKTGDIFALVDEFGEVFITSYNKTRYRISKMDITNILSEKVEKQPKKAPKTVQPKEEKVVVIEEEVVVEEEKKSEEPKQSPIEIDEYDRNNAKEAQFIKEALQPLVNN